MRSAGCLKAMRIEVAVTADVGVCSDCMGDPDAPPVNTVGFCAPQSLKLVFSGRDCLGLGFGLT